MVKEGERTLKAPLCRAECLKIAQWAILAKEPACRVGVGVSS